MTDKRKLHTGPSLFRFLVVDKMRVGKSGSLFCMELCFVIILYCLL